MGCARSRFYDAVFQELQVIGVSLGHDRVGGCCERIERLGTGMGVAGGDQNVAFGYSG